MTTTHNHNPTGYRAATRCCPLATEAYRLYRKRLREGRQPAGLIPAIGATRRLQGLVANGHTTDSLADQLNANLRTIIRWLHGRTPTITRTNHQQIKNLAERLASTPGASRRSRTIARRHGWLPLAAWDDDIDNLDAQPAGGVFADMLIEDALAGRISATHLDVADLARLWVAWAGQQEAAGVPCSRSGFARCFGLGEWQARQAVAAAQLDTNPNHAATGRANERTAA